MNFAPPLIEAVKKCLPTFDEKALLGLDPHLESLKAAFDDQFLVLRTELVSRLVEFQGKEGFKKRLKLVQGRSKAGMPEYVLSIQKLNEQGEGESLEIDKKHRVNPSQIIVSSYLAEGRIFLEEKDLVDTRLNGLKLYAHFKDQVLTHLKMVIVSKKQTLACELTEKKTPVCGCQ